MCPLFIVFFLFLPCCQHHSHQFSLLKFHLSSAGIHLFAVGSVSEVLVLAVALKVRFICLWESHKIPSDGSVRTNELFLLIRPKLFPVVQGRVTIPSLSQWWENSVGTHDRNSDNEVGVQALLTATAHRWESAVSFDNCAAVLEAVEVCVSS